MQFVKIPLLSCSASVGPSSWMWPMMRGTCGMLLLLLIQTLSGWTVSQTSGAALSPSVRLVNSNSSCSGRVEIFHNGTWGTVCDHIWDVNDAQVVCQQLGCGRALSAPESAHFGQGSGPIWLDNLQCSGTESSLTACKHSGLGTHNCDHSEDAGVVCGAPVFEEAAAPESRSNFCPSGWLDHGSRCFMFISTRMTWYKAEEHCNILGGHLASATNPKEYHFLQQMTAGQSIAWLGGFNLQGQWMWIDREGFFYTNWHSQASSSRYPCIYLRISNGWSNTRCGSSLPFICYKNTLGC